MREGNSMNNPNDNTTIVPFGKYKGQPIEVLASDAAYANWLTAQPWFRDRFANIYNVIINNTGEPAETPEHNELQALFLSDEFCLRFLDRSHPGWAREDLTREWSRKVREAKELCSKRDRRFYGDDPQYYDIAWTENLLRDGCTFEALPITYKIKREFEYSEHCHGYRNIDVFLSVSALVCDVDIFTSIVIAIELKPFVGDDYPAVLRQMRTNRSGCLFLRDYHGTGATREQFVQMFQSANIRVVFISEV
jgi:hypothetical protein